MFKMLEASNTDTISHIQELNWYDPNNALITTSLPSPGSAQVDSRSGRGTSFSPWAEWRHGRRGSMRQPLLGRAGPRPWETSSSIGSSSWRSQPPHIWPVAWPLPMQISPQIIAGQCPCPARAPPYLTHAGDLIWDCISCWFGRISYKSCP